MAFVISLVGGVVRGVMGKDHHSNDRNYSSQNNFDYNNDRHHSAPYPNGYQNFSQDPYSGYQAPYTQGAMGYPQTAAPCVQRHGQPCSCVECHHPRAGISMTRRECKRECRRHRRVERDIRRAERRGVPVAHCPATCAHPEYERNHRGGGLNSAARDIGLSIGQSITGRNRENGQHGQQIRGEAPLYDAPPTQQRRVSFDEEGLREMDEPPAYEQVSSSSRRLSVEVLVPEQKKKSSS